MGRMALLVGMLAMACGGKGGPAPAGPPPTDSPPSTAVAEAPPPPAAKPEAPKPEPAKPAPKKPPTATLPPAPPRPKALATVTSQPLVDWLVKRAGATGRVEPKALPAGAAAALTALAAKMSPKAKRIELRWAHVLSSSAIAFSYRVPPAGWGSGTYEFSVALTYPGKATFGSHSKAVGYPKPEGTNDWSTGKAREIDGDGVVDLIVNYDVGMSGGGDDLDGGTILLGSRGGAVDVSLYSANSSYDTEGECDNKSERAAVLCWTTMDKRPLLVAVVAAVDHCAKKKRPVYSYAAVGADADGRLAARTTYARVTVRGTRGAIMKKRLKRGANAPMPVPKDNQYDAPACGAGPLAVPYRRGYALIDGFTPTKPKGSTLEFKKQ